MIEIESIRVKGDVIMKLRMQKGIERAELAEMLNITYKTLWRTEMETHTTSPRTMCKIARVLDVDPTELVPEEDQVRVRKLRKFLEV